MGVGGGGMSKDLVGGRSTMSTGDCLVGVLEEEHNLHRNFDQKLCHDILH